MSGPFSPLLTQDILDAAVALMGRSGRGAVFPVEGRSMCPTLVAGELVAVEFSPPAIARGDVLLFRQANALVVHRLLGPARPAPSGALRWRTRGDGQPNLDPPVDPERIVGRAVAVLRDGRWRSLRGAGARFYGRCLAWHDLSWAAAAVIGLALDGRLERLGLPSPCRRLAVALDRLTLAVIHRVAFRWLHPVVPAPADMPGPTTVAPSP
jgi:hypothetical protein